MDKFSPGENIILNGERWDEMGFKVPALLNWQWRHDQSTGWEYIGSGELLSVIAPDKKGEYHLKLDDGTNQCQIKIVIQEKKGNGKNK